MTRSTRARLPRVALLAAVVSALGVLAVPPAASSDHRPQPKVSREVVGTSVQGRNVTLIRRAHEGASTRVLVLGSMHGDERAGMRVVRRLLARPNLPADLDLWMLRTINPDGTAANRRTNARGVDLNRNFPYRWRASSPGPTWSGPKPMSQPESRTLRRLIRRLDPWLVVTFHQPLFGVGANDKGMPTVRALAAGMDLPVREFRCTGVCYGTFSGWVNQRTEGLAVTVEFARTASDWQIARAANTLVRVGVAGPPGTKPEPTPTTTASPTPTLSPTTTPTPTPTPTPTATATETSTPTPTPTSTAG